MVLNDVANRTRRIIKSPATLNAKILRHGDLHRLDVSAVPERFQKRILEAKEDHVVDGPLPQVMVDAKDRRLVERDQQNPIELASRRQIMAEGLFHDYSRVIGRA